MNLNFINFVNFNLKRIEVLRLFRRSRIFFKFSSNFQLIACTAFAILLAIPSGNTLVPRKIELITFGDGNYNNFLEEEIFIPKPNPANVKLKGKTATGKECFCFKDSTSLYLPPVKDNKCFCEKKCCEERLNNQYLPPENCEICPKCICDRKTFTLINKESGHCPVCRCEFFFLLQFR